MTITDAIRLLGKLRIFYPINQVPDETLALYAEELRDCETGALVQALDNVKRTAKWFPSLAEILNAVGEVGSNQLPSPDDAWNQIRKYVAENSIYGDHSEALARVHPIASDAAGLVGWAAIRNMRTGFYAEEKKFMRFYSARRKAEGFKVVGLTKMLAAASITSQKELES